jgi:signal transduction histidine kinase
MNDAIPTFLLADYAAAMRDLRIRQSKIGCILTFLLMPAGCILDVFVYPQQFWPFCAVRILCDLLIAAVFGLHFTGLGRKLIPRFGFLWVLLPVASISWMIYATEGSLSPYYAGLLLVITGICMLFPWTMWETITSCAIIIVLYVCACVFNAHAINGSYLFNGLYFMFTTSIMCVIGSYYTAHRRFEDFRLRHELDQKNGQISSSYQKLAVLDRLRSQFFANISHELRTPLTLIIAPIDDLLRDGRELPEGAAEALKVARQNALRLLKLINDLLEVVRLDEKSLELKRERLDAATFASGLAESLRYLAEAKGLSLACQGPDERLPIYVDPARLEKAIINLLTNAIKFTPKGGSIMVRWRRDGDQAVVEVADTGVGIPEAELPRIFERFHQVDGSSTRKYQGAGIGLALAQGLVEANGGQLTVESTLGAGTTLAIRLPLATEDAPCLPVDRAQLPDPAAKPEPESDRLADIYRAAERGGGVAMGDREAVDEEVAMGQGTHTVLVVDDEPDMRRYLISRLVDHYRVLQSGDGLQALDLIRRHHPHLVVLDLMLPGMDGLQVCQAVRQNPALSQVKILLLTARMDEESKITALRNGADDFLTKPFSTTELTTRIAGLLRTASLQQALGERATELEGALRQLKSTESQLVHSEKMSALGTIAAGLLHEINNPLNFTITALQVANRQLGPDDGAIREVLQDIGQGMHRIKDLVSDLGIFAYKSQSTELVPIALDAVVDSALRLTAHELAGIGVERQLAPGLMVQASKTQLCHVFMNLLINSAKALKQVNGRPPAIVITSRPEGERALVTVRDNGCGIPSEVLPHIFEPFFTTREVGQGTGLGLSICHTIIANHGGTIAARSEPGQWTEFTFTLALAASERPSRSSHD